MADSNPAKSAPTKATMAPAARDPEGAGSGSELENLRARLVEAEADRDAAYRALDAAGGQRPARSGKPYVPSFGMSEGERAELEAHGETNSPWTGQKITGDGSPLGKSDR